MLTRVGAVVNAAWISSDDTVAVFGQGGVGMSAVLGARLAGARTIIAVDPVASKLELAQRIAGVTPVAAGEDVVERIRSENRRRGVSGARTLYGGRMSLRASSRHRAQATARVDTLARVEERGVPVFGYRCFSSSTTVREPAGPAGADARLRSLWC